MDKNDVGCLNYDMIGKLEIRRKRKKGLGSRCKDLGLQN
jgi:hypothetical protein